MPPVGDVALSRVRNSYFVCRIVSSLVVDDYFAIECLKSEKEKHEVAIHGREIRFDFVGLRLPLKAGKMHEI